VDRACDLAIGENLQPVLELFDHTEFDQLGSVKRITAKLVKNGEIDNGVLFTKDVREAALWQTAMERHLAALESTHPRIAANGFGTLCATTGVFAPAGTHTLTNTLFLLYLPGRRFDITEVHLRSSPREGLFDDPEQMRHFGHHSPKGGSIGALDDPVHLL
jgi:hypothetical protein